MMIEKVTNDAVAHIKGLADKRGRNAEWAERAVRESVSITEKEAVKNGVADLIAEDISDLLEQLDGREISLGEEKRSLKTLGIEIRRFTMDWRYRVLDKISDPNIAYILMMLGIYGLFFELSNPGSLFPGIVGGIFLLLAFFALQVLPINTTGILLILLAIVLFLLEIKITSYGLLTIGGVTAMILGSLMLFKTPVFRVSLSVIITFVIASAAFFVFAMGMALRTHRSKATTGKKGLMGEKGEALTELNPVGQVAMHGEIWKAESTEKIGKGEKVIVEAVEGLVLKVKKMQD